MSGTASDTYYCSVTQHALNPSGCTNSVPQISIVDEGTPNASVVASDLFVRQNTPPGPGATRTYTLEVNDSDTGFTCAISGPGTTCTSATPVTIPPGSTVLWKVVNSSTAPATATAYVGWRASAP